MIFVASFKEQHRKSRLSVETSDALVTLKYHLYLGEQSNNHPGCSVDRYNCYPSLLSYLPRCVAQYSGWTQDSKPVTNN